MDEGPSRRISKSSTHFINAFTEAFAVTANVAISNAHFERSVAEGLRMLADKGRPLS